MKKFHYRKRWITGTIGKAVKMLDSGVISVITLTGARQVGKTTFVRHEEPFKSWDYLNLDDLDTLALIRRNPEALLKKSSRLVIDEVQRAPELLLKIKMLADEGDYRFILTGSANLLLMKKVSETLAGRSVIFTLHPFAAREWEEIGPGVVFDLIHRGIEPVNKVSLQFYNLKTRILNGSMPATLLLNENVELWWEGYVKTYLERDLRDVSSISNLADFHRMLEILSLMDSELLEETKLARDIGISVPTVHRWINLLEVSFIIFRLKPFLKGRIARIRKTPKIYFVDPALAFFLMGTDRENLKPEDWGKLFENFVFLQLLALRSAFGGEIYYWRTLGSKEREVDFIYEFKNRIVAVEAKFKDDVGVKDAQNLLYFCEYNPCDAGVIVYKGKETFKLLERIWAVPVWEI